MDEIIFEVGAKIRLRGRNNGATVVEPERIFVDGIIGGACQLFCHFINK